MGACSFSCMAEGSDAKEAFGKAVEDAQYENGHGGYTGTIAEKGSFVMITCDDPNPHAFADKLVDQGDPRIDDKWGPAGCISLGDGKYLFFGWASS